MCGGLLCCPCNKAARHKPPQGHQQACSEYLPVGRGMWGRCKKKKKAFSHMRKQAHIVCCKSSGAENVENIKILNIVGEY